MSKRRKKKRNGQYMKVTIGLVLLQAIVYTWVHLFLSYKIGVEIAPTASIAFYTMCVGELGICGWIKNEKSDVKKEDDMCG